MKLLTLSQFLSMFDTKSKSTSSSSKSFAEFMKNAQVKSGNKYTPLNEYMKRQNIASDDMKLLYHHIMNRNEYLTRFYNKSLEVNDIKITEKQMPKSYLDNNASVNYKNIIRNIHFRNILQKTKSEFENIHSFLDVLFDLYLREIIDYKIVTPSAIHYLRNGRIGSVFSSFYFRASIMNPYLVYSLNMSVLKGSKIFTPTLGWTSYAYGFCECHHTTEYVGVDVIPDVCQKTDEFIRIMYPAMKHEIICKPSEDLLLDSRFLKKYRGHFDTVFFSPPYYQLELYPGVNQSTERYKTYQDWLSGYWHNTIKLCHHVLEKNGTLCYILSADYKNDNAKNGKTILQDMNEITKEMFTLKMILPMHNKNVHVTDSQTKEKIMIFTKNG